MYGGFERANPVDVIDQFSKHIDLFPKMLSILGLSDRKLVFVGLPDLVRSITEGVDLKIDGVHNNLDDILNQIIIPATFDKQISSVQLPNSYQGLKWGYGDGFHGKGVRILIESCNGQEFVNVGNVITVFDENNNIVGIDSGGGVEKTLQAIYGGRATYDWSGIFDRFNSSQENKIDTDYVGLLIGLESVVQILSVPDSFSHPLSVVRKDLENAIDVVKEKQRVLGLDDGAIAGLVESYIENSADIDHEIYHRILQVVQSTEIEFGVEF